jgi:hypothetical protein
MSSRERWTVYPLLFLAIGLAVRAAALPAERFETLAAGAVESEQIVCREIVVTGTDGTVLVHIGRVVGGGGGRIEIKDADGVDAIAVGTRPESRDGVVERFDARGQPVDEYARQDSNPQASGPKFEADRFRTSRRNHEIGR